MADKMMRIAARGADGTAKPVKSDNNGNLTISLLGDDGAGNPVKITAIQNPSTLKWYLGSVNMAVEVITPTHSTATATASSVLLLASNASRKYAILVNDSEYPVYIKIGAAAVRNQGIRINPNGGSYEMSSMLGNLSTGAIYGISSDLSSLMLITEGV